MSTENVIKHAFSDHEKILQEEVLKDAKFKYIGSATIDLYVYTSKQYVAKKIKENILKIKDSIFYIEKKKVRNVYINNIKLEIEIVELKSKRNIEELNMGKINFNQASETSGENDILDNLFVYEKSVLNKTKVKLHMYNKSMNREWVEEVNMSMVKNKLSIKRKSLIKKITELVKLKYEPINNDTKEIIKLLKIR